MAPRQAVSEFCWSLDPQDRYWSRMILATRAFTIGGATTEVQLNIIASARSAFPGIRDQRRDQYGAARWA
ncbi:hypothetical protein [Nonomuraea rubra]|uniref:hypothetical protein n=1 Tax=Nonomuraea rubra TaxID=46180 RepID=UPI0031F16D40